MSSTLKRTMSCVPSPNKKPTRNPVLNFFEDLGDLDLSSKEQVRLGLTRLNLIFDINRGPYAALVNFDQNSDKVYTKEDLDTTFGTDESGRLSVLDEKIDAWLCQASDPKLPLSDLKDRLDVTTAFPGFTEV